MNRLRVLHVRLLGDRGQTIAEYALLIGLIAVIVLVAGLVFGSSIGSVFRSTSARL